MAQVDYTKKDTRSNPMYRAWHNMRMRCNNPNTPCYANYGGRGITVCASWRDFDRFYEDMISDFQKGLQLDRIDNDSGYSPDNCRWVTNRVNSNNRRNNRKFTYSNQSMTLTQWAAKLGKNRSTLAQRFYVYGWSIERVLGS